MRGARTRSRPVVGVRVVGVRVLGVPVAVVLAALLLAGVTGALPAAAGAGVTGVVATGPGVTGAAGPGVTGAAGPGAAGTGAAGAGLSAASGVLLPRGAWRWPTTTEPAVLRRFAAPAQRWAAGHRGVDLAATAGDAVLAPVAGVVVFAGTVVDRPVLSLVAADGTRTSLEPVTASIPVGASVAAGDVVGVVATGAGHCGGADCLHWGVRRGRDAYVDPLLLVGRPPGPPVLLPLTGPAPGAARWWLRGPGSRGLP